METIERKERVTLYDWIRIFAIFLVVVGHAGYTAWSGDAGNIAISTENACSAYFKLTKIQGFLGGWAYSFHMALFMALSGAVFGLSSKKLPLDILAVKKFFRLIVPYVLVALLWMFPLKYFSGFYPNKKSLLTAMGIFFEFRGCSGHLWFLLALFWNFIVFYIINEIAEKIVMGGTTVCLLILAMVVQFSIAPWLKIEYGFVNGMNYFLYFTAGFCFERFRKTHTELLGKLGVIVPVFLVLLFFSSFHFFKFQFMKDSIFIAFFQIALLTSFCCICDKLTKFDCVKKILLFLSSHAFMVYLLHDPINFIVLKYGTNMIQTKSGAIAYYFWRLPGNIIVCIMVSICVKFVWGKIKRVVIHCNIL